MKTRFTILHRFPLDSDVLIFARRRTKVDWEMFQVDPLPEVFTLPQAIARVEGWYMTAAQATAQRVSWPVRCQRNNNPGNINFGHFSERFGAVLESGSTPRFALFPTVQAGWDCLEALLKTDVYSGKTIQQAIATYAPSSENNVATYVADVCVWMRCTPSDLVEDHLTEV